MRDKFRLWELLDEQMAHAEEKEWEEDPNVQAGIQEARDAYQAGDYVILQMKSLQSPESIMTRILRKIQIKQKR